MDNASRFENTYNITAVKKQLDSTPGLPFSEILSAKEVTDAVNAQNIEFRDRFFFTPHYIVDISLSGIR